MCVCVCVYVLSVGFLAVVVSCYLFVICWFVACLFNCLIVCLFALLFVNASFMFDICALDSLPLFDN